MAKIGYDNTMLRMHSLLTKVQKKFETHNTIYVSRSALVHNLNYFRKSSDQQVIPVLKANAYGHGISLVARALREQKVPYIAVDGYFEALRVRQVSRQPVLIMGAILPQNYQRLKYDSFAFVVQDKASIDALGKTKKHIKIHLEINTGMNRYGVQISDVVEIVKHIQTYKTLELEGVMSHLADSDGNDPKTVTAAVQQFDNCIATIRACGAKPSIIHIAQSAGSLQASSKYANAIRLGIGLYGINPFAATHPLHKKLAKHLRPALALTSTITKIIPIKKGEGVGYNYTYSAQKNLLIGVLPFGYHEGLNRKLSNKGTVEINGRPADIVGRICMNHTMIIVNDLNAKVGDTAIIYSSVPGSQQSIDFLARTYNLFNYNMLAALSGDTRRVLID